MSSYAMPSASKEYLSDVSSKLCFNVFFLYAPPLALQKTCPEWVVPRRMR